MGRKVLGTALVFLLLGVIVLIARDNPSLEDWTTITGDDEVRPGTSVEV